MADDEFTHPYLDRYWTWNSSAGPRSVRLDNKTFDECLEAHKAEFRKKWNTYLKHQLPAYWGEHKELIIFENLPPYYQELIAHIDLKYVAQHAADKALTRSLADEI